jgi:hypothetical protein
MLIRGARISNHPGIYHRFIGDPIEAGLNRDLIVSWFVDQCLETFRVSQIWDEKVVDVASLSILRQIARVSSGQLIVLKLQTGICFEGDVASRLGLPGDTREMVIHHLAKQIKKVCNNSDLNSNTYDSSEGQRYERGLFVEFCREFLVSESLPSPQARHPTRSI